MSMTSTWHRRTRWGDTRGHRGCVGNGWENMHGDLDTALICMWHLRVVQGDGVSHEEEDMGDM